MGGVRTVVLTTKVKGHLNRLAESGAGYVVRIGKVSLVSEVLARLSSFRLAHIVVMVKCGNGRLHSCVSVRCGKIGVRCVRGSVCSGAGGVCSLTLTGGRLRRSSALLVRSSLVFSDDLFSVVVGRPCPGLTVITGCRP